jgi:hypothetical protein
MTAFFERKRTSSQTRSDSLHYCSLLSILAFGPFADFLSLPLDFSRLLRWLSRFWTILGCN